MGDNELKNVYGIRFQQIYPHDNEDLADCGIGRAVIAPRGSTEPHSHPENEVFLLIAGQASMTIADETMPVTDGDAVFIPADTTHHIANASANEDLRFMSVYWPAAFGSIDL
jgi:methionyl-tRNA synthetase